ncbi:DUF4402 domain-containing protein [Sphingorhabdus sp. 109]|jgi:hypothetical protein|uniref:DUF4402 domain-containing protein n=1 Tax=Sphingorhabdus sp. 109 TaxID=2653173 RepID=UPI0012F46706|nr:DUF4402 domain-containing protein [Sphingorhabdus sp. 109]VWX58983.1 conserved exported hypothetical protein [Sphingorhabdus sp. 109]
MTREQILPRLIGGLFVVLVILTGSPAAFAQASNTDARAVTIGPLSVVKTQDLRYGNIISGTGNGTVTVDTRNGNVSTTGDATLAGGVTGPANFIIYGGPNQIVEISIPGSLMVTHTNGTDQMRVDQLAIGNGNRNFSTFVRGLLGTLGIYNLTVGGRLRVNGNQQTGAYRGSFIMTVDYQ